MACPLFIPSAPLGELVSITAPLGDLYGGGCAADPSAAIDRETLLRCCNFGYARRHCDRAAQSDADAVRLMVRAENGNVVEIAWAVERDHHPVAVGVSQIDTADFDTADVDIASAKGAGVLARQAWACAAAYKRQTGTRAVSEGRIAATTAQR
jgi:hypothetical protein